LLKRQASRRVDDLFEDLRDGHNLLSLLEVLSGEHLVRFKQIFLIVYSITETFLAFLASRKGKNAIPHAAKRSDGAGFLAIQEDKTGEHQGGGYC
jgi:hypothetical protein